MKVGEMVDAQQASPGTYDSGAGGQSAPSPTQAAATADGERRAHESAVNGADSKDSQRSSTKKHCVKIALFQLPADGRVRISLREKESSAWAVGDPNADLVGIALETTSRGTAMKLNNFIINKRELIFSSYGACDEIKLTIYVLCENDALRGSVDLPLGASVTFQSEVDRTSLIGMSSFSLNFSE